MFPIFITREEQEDGTKTLHILKEINRKETQQITMAQFLLQMGLQPKQKKSFLISFKIHSSNF
jgi:hypothetical protein